MGYIGNHVSSSGGFFAMGAHELDLGGDTFAFFTRNPRGGASRAADPEDAAKLMRLLTEHSFGPLVAHAPYTLNACSTNERVAAFAREAMTGDLLKMQLLPGQFYNFHPGSHLGQGPEKAIPQIAAVVNEALAAVPEGRTTVLLETMAGKGSEVGRTFEELRMIMDRIDRPERIGVTLDTCHVWDAGYDIAGNLDGVLKEFDEVIGMTAKTPADPARTGMKSWERAASAKKRCDVWLRIRRWRPFRLFWRRRMKTRAIGGKSGWSGAGWRNERSAF